MKPLLKRAGRAILILVVIIIWIVVASWAKIQYPLATCRQTIHVLPGDGGKAVRTETIIGFQVMQMYLVETSTGQRAVQDDVVWEQIEPGAIYCATRNQSLGLWPIKSVVQGACSDLSDRCDEGSSPE